MELKKTETDEPNSFTKKVKHVLNFSKKLDNTESPLSEMPHDCERMNNITVHKKIALLHKVLSTLFQFLFVFLEKKM